MSLDCNAEILFALKEQGEVLIPNDRATNFKHWMSSPALKFDYKVKGELTKIIHLTNVPKHEPRK